MFVEDIYCRTCLKPFEDDEPYYDSNYKEVGSRHRVRDKLAQICSYMEFDDSVKQNICLKCYKLLEYSFIFHEICLKTLDVLSRTPEKYLYKAVSENCRNDEDGAIPWPMKCEEESVVEDSVINEVEGSNGAEPIGEIISIDEDVEFNIDNVDDEREIAIKTEEVPTDFKGNDPDLSTTEEVSITGDKPAQITVTNGIKENVHDGNKEIGTYSKKIVVLEASFEAFRKKVRDKLSESVSINEDGNHVIEGDQNIANGVHEKTAIANGLLDESEEEDEMDELSPLQVEDYEDVDSSTEIENTIPPNPDKINGVLSDVLKETFIVSPALKEQYPSWFCASVVCVNLKNVQEGCSRYVCNKCNKHMGSKHNYRQHLKIHIPKLACHLCSGTFKSEKYLKLHQDRNCLDFAGLRYDPLVKTEFQCPICERYFMSKQLLKRHITNKDGTCKKDLSLVRLINKELINEPQKKPTFHDANEPVTSVDKKNKIENQHANHENDQIPKVAASTKKGAVNTMKSESVNENVVPLNLNRSIKRRKESNGSEQEEKDPVKRKKKSNIEEGAASPGGATLRCVVNFEKPQNPPLINSPIDTLEQNSAQEKEDVSPATTSNCATNVASPKLTINLRRNKSMDQECFKCGICGVTFKSQMILKIHLRIHGKICRCEKCEITFLNEHDLDMHLQWHEKFKCKLCHKCFKNSGDLERHQKLHTLPNGNYRCLRCNTQFDQLEGLASHTCLKN